MKKFFVATALALGLAQAYSMTITPIYGTGYTAAEESAINSTIAFYDSSIKNNIAVTINFANSSTGLGGSSWYAYDVYYPSYVSALETKLAANPSNPVDAAALASLLPSGTTNPVGGNNTNPTSIFVPPSLSDALGLGLGGAGNGTISINLAITSTTPTAGLYSLQTVAAHEIDEILGTPSGLNLNTPNTIMPIDLYRYTAPGVRSFTNNTSVAPYLSFNGGVTNLVNYNHDGSGDWGDFASGQGLYVQNAYGPPGTGTVNPTVELQMLDAIGYTVAAVPEPNTLLMLAVGLLAISLKKRSKLN